MIKRLVGELRCRAFDFLHGDETCGNADLDCLSIQSVNAGHGVHYQPTHPKLVRQVIENLPIEHSQYTLLDYGSGKGRVLLVAASYPFKRVMGIKFARELHEVALRNVRRFRGRLPCRCIECVHSDATDFDVPPDPLVLFMANPFRPPVMRAVLAKVQESLMRVPRDAWLIYVTPFHTQCIPSLFAIVEQKKYHNLYHAPLLDTLPQLG